MYIQEFTGLGRLGPTIINQYWAHKYSLVLNRIKLLHAVLDCWRVAQHRPFLELYFQVKDPKIGSITDIFAIHQSFTLYFNQVRSLCGLFLALGSLTLSLSAVSIQCQGSGE